MTQIRVAVCGSSLYMTGLAASLERHPDVALLRVPTDAASLSQHIGELAPAMILFDLDELPGDFTLSLLRVRPELVLVGFDPSSERLLVLSSRREQPVSAAELLEVIIGDRASTSEERDDERRK